MISFMVQCQHKKSMYSKARPDSGSTQFHLTLLLSDKILVVQFPWRFLQMKKFLPVKYDFLFSLLLLQPKMSPNTVGKGSKNAMPCGNPPPLTSMEIFRWFQEKISAILPYSYLKTPQACRPKFYMPSSHQNQLKHHIKTYHVICC